jgi:hypothetical protein
MGICLAVSRSIDKAHEGQSWAEKTILTSVHDSHSSCFGEEFVTTRY